MQKIMPCLWFDGQAEEAARFYTAIFPNSKMGDIARCGETGPGPKGSVLTVRFQLDGQDFFALNGGPQFRFTEAISLMVNCDTQVELDRMWDKLCEGGGQPVQCGWLKDKFGLSWQIIPSALMNWMNDPDPARSQRVLQALWSMKKLDIKALEEAYRGS